MTKMVFINEIEQSEFTFTPWVEDIDSGYCSGPNSPGPLSPPPPTPQSDINDPFNYYCYPVVPCIVIPWPFFQDDYHVAVVEKHQELVDYQIVGHRDHYVTPYSISRLIKWSLPPPTSPSFSLPEWQPMPYGMEQFWQSAFAWFFRPWMINSGHVWTMKPVTSPPIVDEWPWHTVSYSAKVRFQCQYKHGWTSMKGRVVFWYRMRRHDDLIISETQFKLYGQQCKRCCKIRQDFLDPLWYHEEIENAVRYLACEVAKTYYGGDKLPVPRRVRQGNPSKDNHHDPTRCQACVEGLCVIRY